MIEGDEDGLDFEQEVRPWHRVKRMKKLTARLISDDYHGHSYSKPEPILSNNL